MSEKFDEILQKVYDGHNGIGQELKFAQTVFGFLRRKAGYLKDDSHARKMFKMAKMHVARSKVDAKAKISKTKEKSAVKTPEEPQPQKKKDETSVENNEVVELDDNLQPLKKKDIKPAWEETKKDDGVDENPKDKPVGNGGQTEKYLWTQTLKELTVHVWLQEEVKSRDLIVKITPTGLKIQKKGNKEDIVSGDWHEKIVIDDSTWVMDEVDGKKALTIYVLKQNQMNWWNCVLQGDPEIDTQKIQPENSKLSDLDGSTRSTVEKMMFDQNQKRLGKPTSAEMNKQEMLKKFMAQHPEMDFSNAKIM